MNVVRHTDSDFAERIRSLVGASSLFDPLVEERTRAIVEDVRRRGDAALLELTERFDGAKLTAEQLPVSTAELLQASIKVTDELRAGRLLAPLNEPALRTRGYFVYAPTRTSEIPAIAAFRNWLVAAGSLADTEYPTYRSSNRS